MTTLRLFKNTLNSKIIDIVELIYDETNMRYIVQWKWKSIPKPIQIIYYNYVAAREKYEERKMFAKMCN